MLAFFLRKLYVCCRQINYDLINAITAALEKTFVVINRRLSEIEIEIEIAANLQCDGHLKIDHVHVLL